MFSQAASRIHLKIESAWSEIQGFSREGSPKMMSGPFTCAQGSPTSPLNAADDACEDKWAISELELNRLARPDNHSVRKILETGRRSRQKDEV